MCASLLIFDSIRGRGSLRRKYFLMKSASVPSNSSTLSFCLIFRGFSAAMPYHQLSCFCHLKTCPHCSVWSRLKGVVFGLSVIFIVLVVCC